MNNWIRSLLTGILCALITFFVAGKLQKEKEIQRYNTIYTVIARPTSPYYSFRKLSDILRNRLEAGKYEYMMRTTGENEITVQVKNVTDTLFLQEILTRTGRIEFREMFIMNDLSVGPVIALANEIAVKEFLVDHPAPAKMTNRDSVSKEVSELLEKMETKEAMDSTGAGLSLYINFRQMYEASPGQYKYPAALGTVSIGDTAKLMHFLHHPDVKAMTPAELVFLFGSDEIKTLLGRNRRTNNLDMYAVRIEPGSEKALIENDDIALASVEYDAEGKPEVLMKFNAAGIKKWAWLTRKNISRPIAIILDNTVIAAPNVLSEITNGSTILSGAFTLDECELLSNLLRAGGFPAELSLKKSLVRKTAVVQKGNNILLAGIVFMICAVLSYIIFKTLRIK